MRPNLNRTKPNPPIEEIQKMYEKNEQLTSQKLNHSPVFQDTDHHNTHYTL